MSRFRELLHDERAQDIAEYSIAMAVIGISAGVVVVSVATSVSSMWSMAASMIAVSL